MGCGRPGADFGCSPRVPGLEVGKFRDMSGNVPGHFQDMAVLMTLLVTDWSLAKNTNVQGETPSS